MALLRRDDLFHIYSTYQGTRHGRCNEWDMYLGNVSMDINSFEWVKHSESYFFKKRLQSFLIKRIV